MGSQDGALHCGWFRAEWEAGRYSRGINCGLLITIYKARALQDLVQIREKHFCVEDNKRHPSGLMQLHLGA